MKRARWINAYLDGRLDPAQRAASEAQMAADPALRQQVEKLARVLELAREAPVAPPPPELTARIMTQVRGLPRPVVVAAWRRPLAARRRTVALASAAVLVLGVLWLRPTVTAEAAKRDGLQARATLGRAEHAFVDDCLADYQSAASGFYALAHYAE